MRLGLHPRVLLVSSGAVTLGLIGTAALTPAAGAPRTAASSPAAATCALDPAHGKIKHVVEIQFDNTHLSRDAAGIPSDLEQMPHLLNFIRGNGALTGNDHTILI